VGLDSEKVKRGKRKERRGTYNNKEKKEGGRQIDRGWKRKREKIGTTKRRRRK